MTTPFSRVFVTPDGERSRIAYWYDQTPKDELLTSMMARARILSIDAYGKEERDRAAQVARSLGRPVISADAIWPQYPLAGMSNVVIISSAWLQANFPGVYEYDHALELQSRGAGVVIITDGPKAVLVVRADGSPFGVEPYEVRRVVDTSGAGDLFKAGIIYGWLQDDWPLEQKVKFACAAAGLNCERDRSVDPPPSLDEILALDEEPATLVEHFQLVHDSVAFVDGPLARHFLFGATMSRPPSRLAQRQLDPAAEASVSVFNPAIYGAYGVYESMQVTDGVVFEQEAHLRRLAHSAAIIDLTAASRPAAHRQLGRRCRGRVRRSPTARSVFLLSGRKMAATTSAFIWAQAPTRYPPGYYRDGATAVTFEAHRFLPEAKSLNSLASFMAQRRARAAGVHEALLYHDGCLTEGSNSNLFAVMAGEVLTAPESEVLVGRHARHRDLAGAGE